VKTESFCPEVELDGLLRETMHLPSDHDVDRPLSRNGSGLSKEGDVGSDGGLSFVSEEDVEGGRIGLLRLSLARSFGTGRFGGRSRSRANDRDWRGGSGFGRRARSSGFGRSGDGLGVRLSWLTGYSPSRLGSGFGDVGRVIGRF
jgi:hypothetical protein